MFGSNRPERYDYAYMRGGRKGLATSPKVNVLNRRLSHRLVMGYNRPNGFRCLNAKDKG